MDAWESLWQQWPDVDNHFEEVLTMAETGPGACRRQH